MSHSVVRSVFRTWAGEIDTDTGTPFYETVNTEQNPTDDVWWSIEFTAEFFSNQTFCQDGETEEGFVTVIVFAQPGTGDTAAITALEAIGKEFDGKTDPDVVIEGFEPLNEMTAGTADNYYRVGLVVNYSYVI
jgi:hypothetical protein